MRKFLVLFIGAVLAISLCSCDFSDTASGGTDSKAPTTTCLLYTSDAADEL